MIQSAAKTGDSASEALYVRLEKIANEHIEKFPVPPLGATPDGDSDVDSDGDDE